MFFPIYLKANSELGENMKTLLSAIALVVGFVTAASATTFQPLVGSQELAASLKTTQPVLLDIRAEGYEEGHVDDAISAPYGLFRGPKENPGQVVDVEQLEETFEKLGLKLDDTIVVISDGKTSTDFGAAARVYWTLKSTGFTDLAILNGGHAAWTNAGFAISKETKVLEPTELDLTFDEKWLADTQQVASVVAGETSAVLVDARLSEFYEGKKAHKAAKQPGTLPGAINHAFTTFFEKDAPAISKISDPKALKATLGVEEGKEVISFCNTGHWAATHWFAVSELAGVKNAKLYAGSMVEYSNSSLPMENVPGAEKN